MTALPRPVRRRSAGAMLFLAASFMLPASADAPAFRWNQTDSSLALMNGDKTVWRLVYDKQQPKSYFHPLATTDGSVLTAFEPADHPWHRGLWFSWKFINGLNYWEENPRTGKSQGTNELTAATVKPAADFSATARLEFSYHPPQQAPVLTEVRRLAIGKPDAAGSYVIDWTSEFTAGAAPVTLTRTPPPAQGGPAWGGYAGLSLRMATDLKDWKFLSSEGHATAAAISGHKARWVDLSGPGAGVVIHDHPANPRHPAPWYAADAPMLYFSPAWLFHETLDLLAGGKLQLRYRVVVHATPPDPALLDQQWKAFAAAKTDAPPK